MTAIIIEDESLVAKDLKKQLSVIAPDLEIVKILETVESAKEFFKTNPYPDLIFADIQLSDGISFDIFKEKVPSSPVIFTTAYDQYAIQAFRLNSIDYLLKPIEKEDLKKALEKFRKLKDYTNTGFPEQFREMLLDLKSETKKKYKSRFTGHLGKSIVAIPEEHVAYFMKETIIFLITKDNKQIVTDYNSLEELEDLVNPERFIRANRQFILHIDSIESLSSHHTGKLEVHLKQPLQAEITVSREKAGEFKKWFEGM